MLEIDCDVIVGKVLVRPIKDYDASQDDSERTHSVRRTNNLAVHSLPLQEQA